MDDDYETDSNDPDKKLGLTLPEDIAKKLTDDAIEKLLKDIKDVVGDNNKPKEILEPSVVSASVLKGALNGKPNEINKDNIGDILLEFDGQKQGKDILEQLNSDPIDKPANQNKIVDILSKLKKELDKKRKDENLIDDSDVLNSRKLTPEEEEELRKKYEAEQKPKEDEKPEDKPKTSKDKIPVDGVDYYMLGEFHQKIETDRANPDEKGEIYFCYVQEPGDTKDMLLMFIVDHRKDGEEIRI